MTALFTNYGHFILFLHVLSAIVWVGGMIAMRMAVHPVIARGGVTPKQMLQNDVMSLMLVPKQRLGITLQTTGRLFNLVLPFVLISFATGLIMAVATQGHHGELKTIFLSKEILWTVMTVNYAYMYFKRAKAWKFYIAGDSKKAKAQMAYIPHILLPLNIFLGLVVLWLGVSLRGF